jgi:hypothetical protein
VNPLIVSSTTYLPSDICSSSNAAADVHLTSKFKPMVVVKATLYNDGLRLLLSKDILTSLFDIDDQRNLIAPGFWTTLVDILKEAQTLIPSSESDAIAVLNVDRAAVFDPVARIVTAFCASSDIVEHLSGEGFDDLLLRHPVDWTSIAYGKWTNVRLINLMPVQARLACFYFQTSNRQQPLTLSVRYSPAHPD